MKALIKTIKFCFCLLLLGCLGVLLYQTNTGRYLEEEIGLNWLFRLRGPLPSPPDVVIVSIDQASAEALHFPDDPDHWPRAYYAQLIRKINQQNPAVIAFNLHFSESRDPIPDQMLAKAMAAKKNVVLSNYLKQDAAPDQSPFGSVLYEPVIEPIPLLSHAALVTAPFPLPKTSSTVKEFWKYSSGGLTTFPVTVFQYFVLQQAYPEILQLLGKIDPVLFSQMPKTFDEFKQLLSTTKKFEDILQAIAKDEATILFSRQWIEETPISAKAKQRLRSWLGVLTSEGKLYLNHYGDVGTILTIPFHQVISSTQPTNALFQDKIILVGYSDNIEPEKYQGFYTTFSASSGKVISPIEIAATAVANMIDQSWLKPLPASQQAGLILAWGIFLTGIFRMLPYKPAMLLTLLLLFAYVEFCLFLFTSESSWLPLVIPLLQGLVLMIWQSAIYLLRLRQVSGAHLPEDVIDQIIKKGQIEQDGILMRGVCLATDIDQYTTLSEAIGPRQIAKLINEYNAVTYPRIKHRKGLVLNNIGDAILAGWVSEKINPELRRSACYAALEIKSAIEGFNKTSPYPLQTRIGLHYGEMDMSFVGADGRYEYRAVGDTVNTATRIEGLNKLLGTRILVSEPVIEGLPEFACRELGTFLLKGRLQPVIVFELMGKASLFTDAEMQLIREFSKALTLFKNNAWELAIFEFKRILALYPNDGPTLFYLDYLQKRLPLPHGLPEGRKKYAVIDTGKITA